MKKFKHKLKAFTLIEMLLVLLIISVLLILIIPNITKQMAHIQSTGCEAQVKMVNSQIEAYTLKHNRVPNSIEDLITEGFIKQGQSSCKSGETISIKNGEAVAE
ncbi:MULTISPECIES: competence type IV pilus major pilin ComGC [Staphylococcus]|uniref:competence type IV pilus major pilin ComGC n=1 Tax=Staphylococcus TaxID=1279 RepID=UPI00024E212D|nr:MULTISPECIES: competence type IV pilus major pilin ComGC [Staphylococcus]EHR87489.1 ComG operon protein 3 [Staphylococcus hominis VCU122]MCC3710986.1 prepilin-type N-terminal cleavage/methylation domain-containing protein [Staphylococcus hominis]MCC3713360.1 prepilin-type N-terminal cleavage/methylation domain-containing protein [Staphylococcus hominis]MCE4989130.1 prepilin-type N-terminal cleavage/methylation domain-containing protein [Staphylococcus hominis]MCI2863796.1 prepilin-type N-te